MMEFTRKSVYKLSIDLRKLSGILEILDFLSKLNSNSIVLSEDVNVHGKVCTNIEHSLQVRFRETLRACACRLMEYLITLLSESAKRKEKKFSHLLNYSI